MSRSPSVALFGSPMLPPFSGVHFQLKRKSSLRWRFVRVQVQMRSKASRVVKSDGEQHAVALALGMRDAAVAVVDHAPVGGEGNAS